MALPAGNKAGFASANSGFTGNSFDNGGESPVPLLRPSATFAQGA
jgi:hypothetical protein